MSSGNYAWAGTRGRVREGRHSCRCGSSQAQLEDSAHRSWNQPSRRDTRWSPLGRSAGAVAGRFPDAPADRFLAAALDVTDQDSITAAVDAASDRFGRIDVVVNNAGHGFIGSVEETSDAELRAVMETNFYGTVNVTRAVLPIMRAQRSGHLVAISSYGGFVQPVPGVGTYGASKFAVEAVYESLEHELADLGISVTIVKPGSLRTEFMESNSIRVADARIDDYAPFMDSFRRSAAAGGGAQEGDPAKAARAIVSFVDDGTKALRLPLGADAFSQVAAKLDRVHADLDIARPYGNEIAVD
jgi:NAD(P)-dependent dehydrogenase (short-subunit alcohol dehydrogenase family)